MLASKYKALATIHRLSRYLVRNSLRKFIFKEIVDRTRIQVGDVDEIGRPPSDVNQ
ncbi:unnamed protein product [Citrullus colocynthis]|uniref:Uncharacterized protein n=1 Tax=Citrullus colocynthis TaxID=252529 RepID=A0ABP0YDV8_9ROSI